MSNQKKQLPRNAGGQAVVEGVMMRTPRAMAVAVRKKDGSIVIKQGLWDPVWAKLKFMRLPVLRGIIGLVEALHNGITALNFSAKEAEIDEPGDKKGKKKEVSSAALGFTMFISFVFAILLFAVLPHAITYLLGNFFPTLKTGTSLMFHLVDGVIKILIFLGYLYFISKLKDIKRIFRYHGAEHKTVFAYENRERLVPEVVQKYSTHHPRCGTSFLILVILVSILVFSLTFPFFPMLSDNNILNQALLILIKIPLLFPVAGLAYEAIKLSGKYPDSWFAKVLSAPGLFLQRITTAEPDDSMVEIAIASLISALKIEMQGDETVKDEVKRYENFNDFLEKINFEIKYDDA